MNTKAKLLSDHKKSIIAYIKDAVCKPSFIFYRIRVPEKRGSPCRSLNKLVYKYASLCINLFFLSFFFVLYRTSNLHSVAISVKIVNSYTRQNLKEQVIID